MFKIQKKLDRSRPFLSIYGGAPDEAKYEQDSLEFGGQDQRLTPYTPEEAEQEEAYAALQEKRDAAEAAKSKATASVQAANKETAAKAAANAPEKKVNPDKPNFNSGWTKGMLLTHAMEKFHVTLDANALHRTLVAQLEGLYEND